MNNCKSKTVNTGDSRCPQEIGFIRRIILTPVNAVFTGEDFDDWLLDNIHAAKPEDRFYPMPLTTGVEDNSTDPQEWSNPIGDSEVVVDGFRGLKQTFRRDVLLVNKLTTFNQQMFRAIKIDGAGRVEMIQASGGGLQGELCSVYVTTPKYASATELQEASIIYKMKNPNESKFRKVFFTDLSVDDIQGLTDVVLEIGTADSNTTIKMTTADEKLDVTAEFSALSTKEALLIDTASSGSVITYDATNNYFTITTATVAGKKIKLVDTNALYGFGVGFKENAATVTVPNGGS